jgi:transposase-like protein
MEKKKPNQQGQLRRRYDEEFKSSALGMIAAGRSVPDVASVLGISENCLYRWRSMTRAAKGPATGPEAEIEQLKLRLRQAEMERDILKKALSIFSRTT